MLDRPFGVVETEHLRGAEMMQRVRVRVGMARPPAKSGFVGEYGYGELERACRRKVWDGKR